MTMDKVLLTAMSIRWAMTHYSSGNEGKHISFDGLQKTFNDDIFASHAKATLQTSKLRFFKAKDPTQRDVDDILNTLKPKISYINAWPELVAMFHIIQAAKALGPDSIFHDSFIDTADDVIYDRVTELFEN